MTDTSNDRTETARRHDDRDLIENAEDAPGFGGTSGHNIGSQDDLKRALDPDAGVTNPGKSDKVQPNIPTRTDNDGANG